MNLVSIKRVLISVSDKTGIVEFAKRLQQWNVEIISTGGTLQALCSAGVAATQVSEITGFPEILDGRVKTLHPKVHAGLLEVPNNPTHRDQLDALAIQSIDMVVVNLYPFEKMTQQRAPSLDEAIELIDIGGPAMVRAAAKNFKYKAVVVDPKRYESILAEMESQNGSLCEETRFELAKEGFLQTSHYDSVISDFLGNINKAVSIRKLPEVLTLTLTKSEQLRYGENPHQEAALYGDFHRHFQKLHGKEFSYNNIVDLQSAVELVEEFFEPTVAIIKHTNPCGAGSGGSLAEAYVKAFATDSKSAFGGIIAVNRMLDMDTARLIDKVFTEVVVAPAFDEEALEFLRRKKDRRLVRQISPLRPRKELVLRNVAGGLLAQTPDDVDLNADQLKVVTMRTPTSEEHSAMWFAWRVAKHVKSNAIVYARSDRTIGIGAGQMARVDSAHAAVLKAQEAGLDLRGTAVASDAFFPFADGLVEAVDAGATAVIQPGGSIRDEEVITAANERNVAMLFTGIRHFKH